MRYIIALGCLILGIIIGAKWDRASAFVFTRNPPETDPECMPRFATFTNGVKDETPRIGMPT